MRSKGIALIYHGNCPDGFGGAYAAWKKFGDAAEYIPAQYGKPLPEHMAERDICFVDFCYDQAEMDTLKRVAKSIVVFDHHESKRAVAAQFPGVFDTTRSGAPIAWKYFHPDTPQPRMFAYLEDYDFYRFALPETRAFNAYIVLEPYEFERWDEIARQMEDPNERKKIIDRGTIYAEHSDALANLLINGAELIEFEGHAVYLVGSAFKGFTDRAGNELSKKQPPFTVIARPAPEGLHVSLRGVKKFNLIPIAEKYGGGGHPQAAAFRIPWGAPIPWRPADKHDEDPRN